MKRTKSDNIDQKIRFRKIGGGSHLMTINGRKVFIKENQVFSAYPFEIPESFRDLIVPVDEGTYEAIKEKEATPPPDAKLPEYFVKHRGGGWWNVVGADNKVLNEKALKKEEAEKFIENLKG